MKNLAKVLVMTLLVGLFGVVAVSSLLATPSVQTPLVATTSYNTETGIRWNEGLGVFEVFNANGISYIASGEYFDASGTKGISTENGMVKADGSQTYNIMQDIAYNPSDVTNLETAFAGGTRHSITTGAVNGRGFILKNFPIIASASAGTALFRENGGTIQNLVIENPTYTDGTDNTGILVYENKGVIDGCEVKGTISTTNVINIASIAYTGNGTIRNCTNYLNIATNGQYAAGIIANVNNSTIFACENYGTIRSNANNSFAGGIAAYASLGNVSSCVNDADITANDAGGILGNCIGTTIKANENFGNITGSYSACGIVGGDVPTLTAVGNSNFGSLSATNKAQIYLGEEGQITNSGIYYYPEINAFLIDSMVGLSYIGSGEYFDNLGQISTSTDPNAAQAHTDNTTYIITKDIDYSVVEGRDTPLVIGAGSTVDGQEHELRNFPLRSTSANNVNLTALFDTIASTATVSNINLHADTTIPASLNEGAIGLLSFTNNGTIKNCVVSGEDIVTTKMFHFGGIASNYTGATAKFEICTNTVNVKTSGGYMGGIVAGVDNASNSMTAINCHNTGNIESSGRAGTAYVGGIAGVTAGELNNCSSSGSITISNHATSNAVAGGLVGLARGSTKFTGGEFSGKVNLGSSTSNIQSIGGAVGFVHQDFGLTVLGFRLTSEAEVNWVSGNRIPYIGGVVGHLAGNNTSLGDITLPDNAGTINDINGSVIWGAKVNGTLNLWRDSSSLNYGGVGGILGGTPASDNSPTINIMNSTVNININIVDTTQNETGIFPIGGVVGFCNATTGQKHTYNVSDTKVDFRLIMVQPQNACIAGIFGCIYGNSATLTSFNNEFNGTIDDGIANSTKTGKTAGWVTNPAYQNVTCGGTGYANSGKYVGVGTEKISDSEVRSYYITEFKRILTELPASADIVSDLTLEDKALVGELEYLLNLIEKNDAQPSTDTLLTSIITDAANSTWFAGKGISTAANVKALLLAYQTQIGVLEGAN